MTTKKTAGSKPAAPKAPAASKTAAGKASAPATGKAPAAPKAPKAPTDKPPVESGKGPVIEGSDSASPSMGVLLGTNVLPSLIEIGGTEVQLGTVVSAAFTASGLTLEAWNVLEEVERDKLLVAQVEAMRADAAAAEAAAVAEATAAAASSAAAAEVKEKGKDKPKRGRDQEMRERIEALFPMSLTLRNNSPIPVVEPETLSHVSPGGCAHVTVHSVASLQTIRQNLDAVAAANYFDAEKLVIDGLPTL